MPEPPAQTPELSPPAQHYDLLVRPVGTRHTFAIRQQHESQWHEFPTLLHAFEFLERHLPGKRNTEPSGQELR